MLTNMSIQDWGSELFSAMQKAGGHSYSNYAVGFNNVDVKAATENKVSVGNTPGKLPLQGLASRAIATSIITDQIGHCP